MRYWGYLAAKLAAAGVVLCILWLTIRTWYPIPAYYIVKHKEPFAHDLGYTLLLFCLGLVGSVMLLFILWDQRLRCRTCGRRLRMPIRKGTHAHVLFGPPTTDYICIYGHGTLKNHELAVVGPEHLDWKKHDDIWTELSSVSTEPKPEDED